MTLRQCTDEATTACCFNSRRIFAGRSSKTAAEVGNPGFRVRANLDTPLASTSKAASSRLKPPQAASSRLKPPQASVTSLSFCLGFFCWLCTNVAIAPREASMCLPGLHLAFFYLFGRYHNLTDRIFSLRAVSMAEYPYRNFSYRALGALLLAQVLGQDGLRNVARSLSKFTAGLRCHS